MSEKQLLIMKALQHRLQQLTAEYEAYKFAIIFPDHKIKERNIIELELVEQETKHDERELATTYLSALKQILAYLEENQRRFIYISFFTLSGKIQAFEFVIENSGNLEQIEAHLVYSSESLYRLKKHMGEFASPRIFREGYITALLETQNMIQQLTNNE